MTKENMIVIEPIDVSEITEYSTEMTPLKEYGLKLKIITNSDYERATNFLKEIKGKYKELDQKRKKITSPLDSVKKSIMELFKNPLSTLSEIEIVVKRSMITFTTEQERIRREKEEALRKQAREEEEALRKQAREEEERQKKILEEQAKQAEKEGKVEEAKIIEEQIKEVKVEAPIAEVPIKVVIDQPKVEGIKYIEKWTATVIDESKIPREYLMPDLKKLNKLAGIYKQKSNIPGVEFVSEKTVSSRSW